MQIEESMGMLYMKMGGGIDTSRWGGEGIATGIEMSHIRNV